MAAAGIGDREGGGDAEKLRADGVARVYTPKDFEINRMIGDIADLVAERAEQAPAPA